MQDRMAIVWTIERAYRAAHEVKVPLTRREPAASTGTYLPASHFVSSGVITSGNAPEALAMVQRNWQVRARKERGLVAAVRLAGPFILT